MSLTHPTFAPLSADMERAIRRHRLTHHCQQLGATRSQLAACHDTADLWQLRTDLLEHLMSAPDAP